MAFIPTPDAVKCEIKFNKNGALVVNILWFNITVTLNYAALEALTEEIIDWWNDSLKTWTTPTQSLIEVIATDMSIADGIQVANSLTTPLAGTASGDDLPSNVAAVVSFLSEQSGRSYRGRNYIAGQVGTFISGNSLTTGYMAAALTAYAAMNTRMNAIGFDHVICSMYHNNAPRTEGVLTRVTDYRMDNVVDTQRRRIPKVFN